MVFVTLLPLGILQLYHSVDVGYYDARSLAYITNSTNTLLEWLRLPGDVLFIVGGVGPLLWLAVHGVIRRGHQDPPEDDDLHLFTEIEHLEPAEASAAGLIGGVH
jgi:nitric oxide reductase subunit B